MIASYYGGDWFTSALRWVVLIIVVLVVWAIFLGACMSAWYWYLNRKVQPHDCIPYDWATMGECDNHSHVRVLGGSDLTVDDVLDWDRIPPHWYGRHVRDEEGAI